MYCPVGNNWEIKDTDIFYYNTTDLKFKQIQKKQILYLGIYYNPCLLDLYYTVNI